MTAIFALLFLLSIPLFIIGLIKPSLFSRLKIHSRKASSMAFGGLLFTSAFLTGVTAPETPQTESAVVQATNTPEQETPSDTPVPTTAPTITVKKAPTNTPVPTKRLPNPTVKKNPTPTKAYIAPTSTPKPVQQSTTSGGSGSSGYSGSLSGDKDCPDFSGHAEAQAYFIAKGGSPSNNVDRLDGDGDGLACED